MGLPYLPGSWSLGIGNTDTTGDNFPRIPSRILTGDHNVAYYKDKTVIDFLNTGDKEIERKEIKDYHHKIRGGLGPKTESINLNNNKDDK